MLFINAITLADSATVGDVQAQQEQKYAFKCHRRGDAVFPVNAMAFHPRGTFASGGCDGVVSVWDGGNKKRLWQSPAPYPTSIAALAFSGDTCLPYHDTYCKCSMYNGKNKNDRNHIDHISNDNVT